MLKYAEYSKSDSDVGLTCYLAQRPEEFVVADLFVFVYVEYLKAIQKVFLRQVLINSTDQVSELLHAQCLVVILVI